MELLVQNAVGPYGYNDLLIDQSSNCQCPGLKFCTFTNPGQSGECMSRIMLPEVIEKLNEVIGFSENLEKRDGAPASEGW